MCSKTSLSSGCNGNNGDSVAHPAHVIHSKKPKRSKVPKRGPGVAELEKILREQENKSDLFQTKNEGFSLFPSLSKSPILIPPFPSPSKPEPVSASDLERFSPSKIAAMEDNTAVSNTSLRVNNGTVRKNLQIGGSRVFFPEHTLLPTMWDSSESITNPDDVPKSIPCSNQQLSSSHIMQKVQYSPPSIMPLIPHSAATATASGLRDSSLEPPSNQTPYPHFNPFWPDEDKMVGTKRLRSYSMDMPEIPGFRCPVAAFSLRMNRLDTSHPYLPNVQPTDAVYRDLKMDGSSQRNSRKLNNEYAEKNIITQMECFNFNHNSSQDMKESEEVLLQRRTASGDLSVEKKPFCSFLNKKDQTNFNLNETDDAEEDAIDLNLKL